jgi:hypothetical protein
MCAHQVGSYRPNVTTDDRISRSTSDALAADHTVPQYEVRVRGQLGTRWAAWFDGLSLSNEDDGTTVIRGAMADQAALHGLLQKLRDIGIPLVSLTQLDAPIDPAPRKGTQEGN